MSLYDSGKGSQSVQKVAGQIPQFCLVDNPDVIELFGHRPENGTGFHAGQAGAHADMDAVAEGDMVS